MYHKILATVVGVAAIGLMGTPIASADHGALNGDQIKQLVSGATGRGTTSRGQGFKTRIGEDGSLKVNVESGFSDTGKWRVDGDNYCSQWQNIRGGKERCVAVKHTSGKKYKFETSDGNVTNIVISK